MKLQIEQLENIQQVEAPDSVFELAFISWKNSKQKTVSYFWISSVAAVFCCLFVAEIYLLSNRLDSNRTGIEQLVDVPNNTLYHE